MIPPMRVITEKVRKILRILKDEDPVHALGALILFAEAGWYVDKFTQIVRVLRAWGAKQIDTGKILDLAHRLQSQVVSREEEEEEWRTAAHLAIPIVESILEGRDETDEALRRLEFVEEVNPEKLREWEAREKITRRAMEKIYAVRNPRGALRIALALLAHDIGAKERRLSEPEPMLPEILGGVLGLPERERNKVAEFEERVRAAKAILRHYIERWGDVYPAPLVRLEDNDEIGAEGLGRLALEMLKSERFGKEWKKRWMREIRMRARWWREEI